MWDLNLLTHLEKARKALKAGRLDEACAILARPDVGEHRQCQVLREELVAPLLDRARAHLAAARAEDALADVTRAHEAGGNRPESAALRQECLAALEQARQKRRQHEMALASARRHLEAGRLAQGAARLDAIGPEDAEAADLRRRLEVRRTSAEETAARIETKLAEGDVETALDLAAAIAALASSEPAASRAVTRALEMGRTLAASTLADGAIERSAALVARLCGLEPRHSQTETLKDALAEARGASAALSRQDWHAARVSVARLRSLLPGSAWVESAARQLGVLEETHRDIAAGPLGRLPQASGGTEPDVTAAAETVAAAPRRSPPPPAADKPRARGAEQAARDPDGASQRYTLWIDGLGSFLVLTGNRVTIGRAGSSAHPDIELAADIDGIHAEILRVDHDYFLVPRGEVRVAGHPVARHLLADGDRVEIGKRCRMRFLVPTDLSATAVLDMGSGPWLPGGVRQAVLVDGHLIFGAGDGAHLRVPTLSGRAVLSAEPTGFRLRAPLPVSINGREAGTEVEVPLDAHVEVGDLSFTIKSAGRSTGQSR